ncbi:MAG: tyrosine-type recombinase/integrase [Polyangiales bacterium]
MGRRATGTVYEKGGALYLAFQLRSKERYTQKVPAHPEGRPATREEARTYLAEVMRRYDLGLWDPEAPAAPSAAAPAAPGPLTVMDYARRWSAALPHETARQEQRQLEHHVAPHAFGRLPLVQVTPRDVAAWVKELRSKPSPRGGLLAPATVRSVVALVSKMFVAAMFEELVKMNPVSVLPKGTVPALKDKDPAARQGWRYTREEVVSLLSDQAIPEDRRTLYAVLFLTGVRIGEGVVLRWGDWDRAREPLGCLTVARALASQDRSRVKPTKTGAVREVPVHPTLAGVLAAWKFAAWSRHTGAGRAPEAADLLVPTREGTRRYPRNVHKQLALDCQAVGIRPRRVHGTRHTFVSLAIDDGARFDVVQRITHTRPVRSAFDQYRTEAWPTLCAEVAKLRVSRASELPLWRAAGADDSAPDTATGGAGPRGNAFPDGGSKALPAPARS